jgi:hypothetical protein
MIISPVPLALLPSFLSAFLPTPPKLVLNVARRTYHNSEDEEYWHIIYYEDSGQKLVSLCVNVQNDHRIIEIPLEEIEQRQQHRILKKRIKRFANLWGTTVEDLVDRIMERRPKSW